MPLVYSFKRYAEKHLDTDSLGIISKSCKQWAVYVDNKTKYMSNESLEGGIMGALIY